MLLMLNLKKLKKTNSFVIYNPLKESFILKGFFYICNMLRYFILYVFLFPIFINAQTAFIIGHDTICDNGNDAIVTIDFTGGVPPFTFTYLITDDNGDVVATVTDTTQNTSYIISTSIAGRYTLQSFNDINSFGTINGQARVTVLTSPKAIIDVSEDTLSRVLLSTTFTSINSVGNLSNRYWDFGDNTILIDDTDTTITHEYSDSLKQIFDVELIFEDVNNCVDTAFRRIWVHEKYLMWVPNSFTPDLDGKNDNFCISYDDIRENTFLLKVYNKQGDLMFESTRPNDLRCDLNGGWDGNHYISGDELASDTYLYEIYFQDSEGWKHQEYGNIILIR